MLNRCDGYYSCTDTDTITATNGANLYFTGWYALGNGGFPIVSTTNEYDILCTSTYSCYTAILNSARNVYCNGQHSCDSAQISNVENIYFYGYQAGYLGIIGNISGNIYAGEYRSLYSCNINNVYGTIHATGSESLEFATIKNVSQVFILSSWKRFFSQLVFYFLFCC